ncbi:MAG: hypothetical protein AB2693_31110 [Candidatus Thiodiazotropha sp.]
MSLNIFILLFVQEAPPIGTFLAVPVAHHHWRERPEWRAVQDGEETEMFMVSEWVNQTLCGAAL